MPQNDVDKLTLTACLQPMVRLKGKSFGVRPDNNWTMDLVHNLDHEEMSAGYCVKHWQKFIEIQNFTSYKMRVANATF